MKLSEYRKLRNLNRAQFGAEVGATSISVWRWETGRCMPKPRMITRIREATAGAVTLEDHGRAFEEFHAQGAQREAA